MHFRFNVQKLKENFTKNPFLFSLFVKTNTCSLKKTLQKRV